MKPALPDYMLENNRPSCGCVESASEICGPEFQSEPEPYHASPYGGEPEQQPSLARNAPLLAELGQESESYFEWYIPYTLTTFGHRGVFQYTRGHTHLDIVIPIDELESEGKRFLFKKSLLIDLTIEPEVCVYSAKSLGIITYAPLGPRGFVEFGEDFAALWDSIAQEQDQNLTADARELKRRLVELVNRVEETT